MKKSSEKLSVASAMGKDPRQGALVTSVSDIHSMLF